MDGIHVTPSPPQAHTYTVGRGPKKSPHIPGGAAKGRPPHYHDPSPITHPHAHTLGYSNYCRHRNRGRHRRPLGILLRPTPPTPPFSPPSTVNPHAYAGSVSPCVATADARVCVPCTPCCFPLPAPPMRPRTTRPHHSCRRH